MVLHPQIQWTHVVFNTPLGINLKQNKTKQTNKQKLVYNRFPGSSAGKEATCNAGDPSSIPGLERSPGGGHGNPLQYSCLENPMGSMGSQRAGHDWATKHSV